MFATTFKKIVSNELAKRFSMGDLNYEESTENLPVLIAQMASLLDPRYKNLKFDPSPQSKLNTVYKRWFVQKYYLLITFRFLRRGPGV